MPAQNTDGKVTLTLSGVSPSPSLEILHYGATVISWKSAASPKSSIASSAAKEELKERFFLSSKSALDGSKAVRGGIPVVFPFFGPPTRPEHQSLPSHGIARIQTWKYEGVAYESPETISVKFLLEPTPEITAKWNYPFILEYIVTLSAHELSTSLQVTNPELTVDTLSFQALLHNYILTAPAPTESITVSPLRNLTYIDKVAGGEKKLEGREKVDVRHFTDSVYLGAGKRYVEEAAGKTTDYNVRWEGGGVDLKTSGFGDVVVWNPAEEAGSKIGDLEEGGWNKYVCVEPGSVDGFTQLAPGKTWVGMQLFTPL